MAELANVFDIHPSTIYDWVAAFEKEGRMTAKIRGGRKPTIVTPEHLSFVEHVLKQYAARNLDSPALSSAKLIRLEILNASGGLLNFSEGQVYRLLHALDYSSKKFTINPIERNRAKVIEETGRFLEWRSEIGVLKLYPN